MNWSKISSILAIICGVVLILASNMIADKVAEGRGEIRRGQRKLDIVNKPFEATPLTKELGQIVTGSSQEKIDAGIVTADKYDQMAHDFRMGGYGLIAFGSVLFLICALRKQR